MPTWAHAHFQKVNFSSVTNVKNFVKRFGSLEKPLFFPSIVNTKNEQLRQVILIDSGRIIKGGKVTRGIFFLLNKMFGVEIVDRGRGIFEKFKIRRKFFLK